MADSPFGKSVRWLVALLLALPEGALLAQGAPWVVKPVHGYRIALAVESILEPARPGEDPRHARVRDHRLRLSIREEATGRAPSFAEVSADVAESGFAGTKIVLQPMGRGEPGLYEGRMRLRTDAPYRVLVHATLAGGGRTLEARFEYRHHH